MVNDNHLLYHPFPNGDSIYREKEERTHLDLSFKKKIRSLLLFWENTNMEDDSGVAGPEGPGLRGCSSFCRGFLSGLKGPWS